MSDYAVKFFTGDYPERNDAANEWGSDIYLDFHFNSGSKTAHYTRVEHTNEKSKDFAHDLSHRMGEAIGYSSCQVISLESGDRGHINVGRIRRIGVILEPLFVSNPDGVEWIAVAANRTKLAAAIVGAVRNALPKGGKVALSIGHKGKKSSPRDRGARAGKHTEAYYAELLAKEVAELLAAVPAPEAHKVATKPTTLHVKPKAPVVKYGDSGAWVKVLQVALRKRGYTLVADGSYGRATLAVVKRFKKKCGFLATGTVGTRTWAKLGY